MSKKPNLLLVEDELVFAKSFSAQLSELGYKISLVTSGEQALKLLQKQWEVVDLILMDIELGQGADGVQTALQIQSKYTIPIVFLSAHTETEVLGKIDQVTTFGLIPKNALIPMVDAAIRMALRLHQAHLELKEKEIELREKDKIFNSFLEHSPIYVFFKDENLRSLKLSKNYENMLGKPLSELLGKNMDELFPSDLAKSMMEDDRQILNAGKPVKIVEEFNNRIYETLKFPIKQENGVNLLAGFTMDVTEQKLAEEKLSNSLKEKEILFKELQHRVKNNLNVISSLLSYELQQVDDPRVKEVFTSAQARIRSMAGIYEKLYQSHQLGMVELSSYIKDFVESLLRIYKVDGLLLNLDFDLDQIQLDLKRAVPLGLILNELISNALKYAFSGKKKGQIQVRFKQKESGLILEVKDDGVGMPPDYDWNQSKSLGFLLINMLSEQIEGKLEFSSQLGKGTKFELIFPTNE